MKSLAQAKTLGGVGSILMLLSIVPWAGMFLGLVGLILVLVAVKYISDVVGDKSIFDNMLIAVFLAIAGVVVAVAFLLARLFVSFREFVMVNPPPEPSMFIGPRLVSFLATVFASLVLFWIFYVAAAVFLRRSYSAIASKLKVEMFDTAALVYLIGAALSVVMVGFFIVYVAEVLQVVAFFSIPEETSQSPQLQPA